MRAFVVGNGPSLKNTPLDLMHSEISFGVNNIHLIYPYTLWRPTHYVRAEEASGMDTGDWIESMNIQMMSNVEIWCNVWFVKWMEREEYPVRQVNIINSCAHHQTNFDSEYCPHLWHLPRLCTFGSTVNVAVQIAVMLGFSPIYLVGCDLGYRDGEPSHFDATYEHGKEQPARLANMNTLQAHVIAKRSTPVPIYNATIGGSLEAYERVNFEDLFTGQRPKPETYTPAPAYR
jgi:hypothetical protein